MCRQGIRVSTEKLACLEGPSEGRLNEEEGTRRLRRLKRQRKVSSKHMPRPWGRKGFEVLKEKKKTPMGLGCNESTQNSMRL